MGFGSGDVNALQSDDSFTNGYYATVQTLEMWNNCRWNQLGEQMALYHSLYNRHRTPPAWVNGGWAVIQNDFDAGTAHLPLKWGYLVFSRGRLTRNWILHAMKRTLLFLGCCAVLLSPLTAAAVDFSLRPRDPGPGHRVLTYWWKFNGASLGTDAPGEVRIVGWWRDASAKGRASRGHRRLPTGVFGGTRDVR